MFVPSPPSSSFSVRASVPSPSSVVCPSFPSYVCPSVLREAALIQLREAQIRQANHYDAQLRRSKPSVDQAALQEPSASTCLLGIEGLSEESSDDDCGIPLPMLCQCTEQHDAPYAGLNGNLDLEEELGASRLLGGGAQ